jgi:hypothetical protein
LCSLFYLLLWLLWLLLLLTRMCSTGCADLLDEHPDLLLCKHPDAFLASQQRLNAAAAAARCNSCWWCCCTRDLTSSCLVGKLAGMQLMLCCLSRH